MWVEYHENGRHVMKDKIFQFPLSNLTVLTMVQQLNADPTYSSVIAALP